MIAALLLAAASPVLDPLVFFAGGTRGEGSLKILLRSRRTVSVRGSGCLDADGALVLDQTVIEQGKPPRWRQWRLRRVGPDRYAGTLSDARGPVTGEAEGGRLHLAFRSRSGFAVEQWLTLADDGRTVANHLEARRLGIVVATLDETIVRLDQG